MGPEKTALESRRPAESRSELEELVQRTIGEYVRQTTEEPAVKSKLAEERRRREDLERRIHELSEENRRSRQMAEQSERYARIQAKLQDLGVKKVPLAFRLVKDEIFRGEDGELYAQSEGTQTPFEDYLRRFVAENPEFLPPRIPGGSGATGADRGEISASGFELEKIRPGMSKEDLAEAWKEVARLAGQGSNSW